MTNAKALLDQFSKTYKRKLGVPTTEDDPPRIPTGIFPLDLAIGGGFPRGRISVVFGPESSMKSTVCLKAVASAQKMFPNHVPVYFDVEGHFSSSWAKKLGVDMSPSRFIYMTSNTAEQTVDMIESMLYATDVSVIVVDSLAALVTTRETQISAEDALVGTAGLLINKFYRKSGRALDQARQAGLMPTLLLINQIRYKIGVSHGDPETMPGGPSFRYASSLTLRLYGKDEFDKDLNPKLPAFKKISAIIKKHKVPVVQRNSEFLVAVLDNPPAGLTIGESPEVNTLMQYLKSCDMIIKADKGYTLMVGKKKLHFLTLDSIKKTLMEDKVFSASVKAEVIAQVIVKGDHVSVD